MINETWYQRPPGVPEHTSAGGVVARVENGRVLIALVGEKTHYFLFATAQVDGVPMDHKHHYAVKWFPIDAFPDLFWPEQTQLIRENRDLIVELINKPGRMF